MEIEKLENITSGLSTALPTASTNVISIAQAVNYLTYKINECVDIINRVDPEVYTKEIDKIKENLEAIEKSIDEKTEDINTINGKITSINLSIDALNEALGHKVSHTNSASVVYANDAGGNETPIKFTSGTDAGTIALRTSTGQVAVTDATADNHAVGYKQMQTYVSEHGGTSTKIKYPTYTNTTKNHHNIVTLNKDDVNNTLIIITGYTGYTSGNVPFQLMCYIDESTTVYNLSNEFFTPHVSLNKTGGLGSYGYWCVGATLTSDETNTTVDIFGANMLGTENTSFTGAITVQSVITISLE